MTDYAVLEKIELEVLVEDQQAPGDDGPFGVVSERRTVFQYVETGSGHDPAKVCRQVAEALAADDDSRTGGKFIAIPTRNYEVYEIAIDRAPRATVGAPQAA